MRVARLSRFAIVGAFGLLLAAAAARLLAQGTASLTLLARDSRRAIPVTVVNDQEFVALDELASTFQLSVREEAGAVTVSRGDRTIVFNPERTIASVAGRMISLPTRPTRVGGRLFVPLDFISRAIAPIHETRIELRRASHLLILGDLRVPRVTITAEPPGPGQQLTIDARPPTASTVTREADHLTIRFDADAIDVTIPGVPPQGFVQAIRRIDPTTLAIDLGPRVASYRSTTQPVDSVTRVTLELLPPPSDAPPTSAAAAVPAVSTSSSAPPADLPAFGPPSTPIRTVTIDPGHGGPDEGVRGAGGLTEKTVTLAVARRVKTALEARLGLRVILTREDDREQPLDARTALANNNKADLFISLHANASFRPTATGASMLVAQFPDEASVRQSLEPHRVPVFGGGMRAIELLLWNQAQIRYVDQSLAFADLLLQQFDGRVPLDARPTARAPLRVLASANMPAVLIELGYLSTPDDESRLGSAAAQGVMAQAIVDAVTAFRDHLSRTLEAER
ncbi:MAG: N-acetylmuramoyl-L-alanine amidase [Vicinamibacterales bacterium]